MCYSDHNEDIRTKGTCDYCGQDTLDLPRLSEHLSMGDVFID